MPSSNARVEPQFVRRLQRSLDSGSRWWCFGLCAKERKCEEQCPDRDAGIGDIENPRAVVPESDIDDIDDSDMKTDSTEDVANRAASVMRWWPQRLLGHGDDEQSRLLWA